MRENKAKNTFEVGEFNVFFREHDVLEQFLRILGSAIGEEKIQENCSVGTKLLPCRSYKISMQSVRPTFYIFSLVSLSFRV